MKRFYFASLRSRLIVLVLLAVLPALGLILFTASEERRAAAAEVQDDALRIARLASSAQERLIEGARQLLIMMAHLPAVSEDDPNEATRLLTSVHKEYPLYTILSVHELNGRIFAGSLPTPPGLDVTDRAYFRRALETRQFAMGDYVIGRTTGKPTVHFAYPVLDTQGTLRRIAMVGLDLAWLEKLAAEAELQEGAILQVMDSEGTILVRWPDPERWRGKSIKGLSFAKRIMAAKEGTIEEDGPDGVRGLYAFTTLKGAEGAGLVRVIIGIPAKLAFAEADRFLKRSLTLLGIVTLLAIAAAWVGGDALVLRRVRALLDATRQVEAGNLAARTHVRYGSDEVGKLAHAFDQMAEMLQTRAAERDRAIDELRHLNEVLEQRVTERTIQLQQRNTELQADLELAREFQLGLLPNGYPTFAGSSNGKATALHFCHRYQPSGEVGGDFFDVLPLSNNQAGIFVCDVMGHGIRAALVTAILRGLVAELKPQALDTARFVAAINCSLADVLRGGDEILFATALYMVADIGSGRLMSTNAGHPRPLHIRRSQGVVEPVLFRKGASGPALGIFPGYPFVSEQCPLTPGDAILAFTDGVTEITAPNGELFGEERLREAVRQRLDLPIEDILDQILREMRAFSATTTFEDDVCLVGIEASWATGGVTVEIDFAE
jgi:serine phosphatase RsbU (regulator of sigma subunit)